MNSPSREARARPTGETRRVDARSAFRSDNNEQNLAVSVAAQVAEPVLHRLACPDTSGV
jgi:hypothetical protein